MTKKERLVTHWGPEPYTVKRRGIVSDPWSITDGSFSVKASETTLSDSHRWFQRTGGEDVGGDFTTYKVLDQIASDRKVYSTPEGATDQYTGRVWPVSPNERAASALAAVSPSSDSVLRSLGTTAISRCTPTNPAASASTFIGELKAGLPQAIGKELLKTKFKDVRKYGSEYLNVEFGWKPIVSDLQKFGKAAIDSEKILRQLHKDSGRLVRRRYEFPVDVVTVNKFNLGPTYSYLDGGTVLSTENSGARGYHDFYSQTVTRTWFSGAFTYHLNLGTRLQDKIERQAAEARKLFGLELTPEVAWNLAPWSWIVDWEGNIGDVLANVSRFSQDGLVMPYGYIMQEKSYTETITKRGGFIRSTVAPPNTRTLTTRAISKVRRQATPFGFGFDMNVLTGRQSAILGALGISRIPKR